MARRPGSTRIRWCFWPLTCPALSELEGSIRQWLAWKSIYDEREILNLDTFQRNQAKTKTEQADEQVDAQIRETFIWLLAPHQSDPRDPPLWIGRRRASKGGMPLAARASKKLVNDEYLITAYGGIRLRLAMDRFHLWGEHPHVSLKQLWEYFCRYPYLPRLRDRQVLAGAMQEGISQTTWSENFAYAEGWDAIHQRYLGLKVGQLVTVRIDGESLLIRPEAAQAQIDLEAQQATAPQPADHPSPEKAPGQPVGDETAPLPPAPGPRPPAERKFKRFYGAVHLDPLRTGRDAGLIAEEVIQHLQALIGADVTITLEIQARLPDGAPENVVRTVTENARTLRFAQFGFEEE